MTNSEVRSICNQLRETVLTITSFKTLYTMLDNCQAEYLHAEKSLIIENRLSELKTITNNFLSGKN